MDDIYTLVTHFKTTLEILNGMVSLWRIGDFSKGPG